VQTWGIKGPVNLVFIQVFKPHTHKLYILRHCIDIVYIEIVIHIPCRSVMVYQYQQNE
jgi:hypothetical protein